MKVKVYPGLEPKLDSTDSIFFTRELEAVKARSYDIQYPELMVRSLVPVDHSIDPAAETIRYQQFDVVGTARILASYAEDLPRVDVRGKEFFAPLRGMGVAFGYSIQEIRRAAMAGKPLEQRKANAARFAIELKIDDIGTKGDSFTGLLGLLNQPNANVYVIPNGASGTPAWATKTPDEILKDLNGIAKYSRTLTHGIETPDTLLLPDDQYTLIATTPRSSTSDTTILQYFTTNNPFIKRVIPWNKLKGAGANAKDRAVAYRLSPDKLEMPIPQEFEMFPPEAKGLEFTTACHARVGGVIAYCPMSITYADTI